MYQPTEQELLEMGFEKSKFRKDIKWILCREIKKRNNFSWWIDENTPLIEYYRERFYSTIFTGSWEFYSVDIFPRSKEHLEQIILAFKP